ncbi:hypothetical protein BJF79_32960 [Actinomadura sp. CNU-125]|uniref:hypothetical protein n=1 Tax=Actinomadura sp. CNU-125 TaxID=1904961 RepID=UPI00095BE84B|nr:hypothetical protein [Actinomadura sp. CNU-125]OLT34794.1 hypothetical protein BJF79_32960 [Actinomadura sp. CNU-125]
MSTIEERLREALHGEADGYTARPDAKARIHHRVRRRRARFAAAGALAAVAVAGASVPVLTGGDVQRDGRQVLTPSSTGPGRPGPKTLRDLNPPTGEVLRTDPVGGRVSRTDVWYSTVNGEAALCWSWSSTPNVGGCASPASPEPDDAYAAHFGEYLGGPPIGGEMAIGVASPDVASVTAELADGRKATGRLLHGSGFPHPVWQVGGLGAIEKVVLADAGGEAIATIEKQDAGTDPGCPLRTRRPDGAVELGGTGVAANWDGQCLVFWNGAETAGWLQPENALLEADRPGGSLTDEARRDGGHLWTSGNRWYGVTGTQTERVEFELSDGTRVEVRTIVPPWDEKVALFAGTVPPGYGPQGAPADGPLTGYGVEGTATGYGADGTALWHLRSS